MLQFGTKNAKGWLEDDGTRLTRPNELPKTMYAYIYVYTQCDNRDKTNTEPNNRWQVEPKKERWLVDRASKKKGRRYSERDRRLCSVISSLKIATSTIKLIDQCGNFAFPLRSPATIPSSFVSRFVFRLFAWMELATLKYLFERGRTS